MSPRKTDVTEEKARRWTELYRMGWSFARIGREEGLDRRVVARVVRQREGKDVGEAAASARKEVASRLLEEHFREMEAVAAMLVRAVPPPSMRAELFLEETDVESLLRERLETWWLRMRQVYLPDSGPDEIDRRRARRQAFSLLAALYEHQPLARPLVEAWGRYASEYHRTWLALEERAQAAGIPDTRARAVVEEALRRWRSGDPLEVGAAPGASLSQADRERVQAWASADSGFQTRLRELASLLEGMERSFASLEEMLDPAPVRRVLLSTRCGLCPA